MADRTEGGMSDKQKRRCIINSLGDLTPDILDTIYRIIFYAECGLE